MADYNGTPVGRDLLARIQRLEDRADIAELIARYGILVDNKDLESICELYSADCVFASNALGTSRGHTGLKDYFDARWAEYGWTYHVTHTQVIDFVDENNATGIVTGHSEHDFHGTLVVAANRYHDHYVRENGGWLFRLREVRILYLLPADELASRFAEPLRKAWPDAEAKAPELPETTAAYRDFQSRIRELVQTR